MTVFPVAYFGSIAYFKELVQHDVVYFEGYFKSIHHTCLVSTGVYTGIWGKASSEKKGTRRSDGEY